MAVKVKVKLTDSDAKKFLNSATESAPETAQKVKSFAHASIKRSYGK